MNHTDFIQHSSHWGSFKGRLKDGELEIERFGRDPDPSGLLANIPASLSNKARLARPLIRKGWLEDGPGPDIRRGSDGYVETDWETALDLAGRELRRLGAGRADARGSGIPGAHVFGGSYGWSSAGRFHHAQSQVHRFLNTVFGGYVRSVDTYSSAAGAVILTYVLANSDVIARDHPYWQEMADDTELVLAFGGLPVRNTAVSGGGNSVHVAKASIQAAAQRGCSFVNIGPLRDDLGDASNAEWLAIRPATDTALMLAMAYHLIENDLADHSFLERYTVGYDQFASYVTGRSDGVPKTPEWAGAICKVDAQTIRNLASRAARQRTFINVNYSLQRAQYGEQPIWMAVVLAAMLGHIGKPGGGFCYGLGSIGNNGKRPLAVPLPTLNQGTNGNRDFIPVARISDLLLKPGETYTYRGETRTYADIRLVYWAGGNPFHHHQDLQRLTKAFSRPDTIIVHESVATATTRHADIVLPATVTLERNDLGASVNDPYLYAMKQIAEPYGEARDDYDIFSALAARLGCEDLFTEGRTSFEWLEQIYQRTRSALEDLGIQSPSFADLWQAEMIELPVSEAPGTVKRFCSDPERFPLPTASGRIEITSSLIESYGCSGSAGHPTWRKPDEWLGSPLARTHRFQLVANQPRTRLHSQLDFGAFSAASKIKGREPARLNPEDAQALGVKDGDTIRIFNDRGSLLAGAVVSEDVLIGVIQLSTGAWYRPLALDGLGLTCLAGNPNSVTRDVGSSDLSQGCSGQLSLVSAEIFDDKAFPAACCDASIDGSIIR